MSCNIHVCNITYDVIFSDMGTVCVNDFQIWQSDATRVYDACHTQQISHMYECVTSHMSRHTRHGTQSIALTFHVQRHGQGAGQRFSKCGFPDPQRACGWRFGYRGLLYVPGTLRTEPRTLIRTRALYIHKKALNIHQKALKIRKKALHISNRTPYTHPHKSIVYPQKCPMYWRMYWPVGHWWLPHASGTVRTGFGFFEI